MALLIDFMMQYGLFLAKLVTFAVILFIFLIVLKSARSIPKNKGELEITNLTDLYDERTKSLESELFEEIILKERDKEENKEIKQKAKEKKAQFKAERKAEKAKIKADKKVGMSKKETTVEPTPLESNDDNPITEQTKINEEHVQSLFEREPRTFVLDFNGSMDANELESLREEISAIISVAIPEDNVILKLESPGGMVHSYGLAASQLMRLKEAKIHLTIVVDQVAASGGYMMACVADEIIAAPFAIIGSIGVVAQLPNFHKLLKKNDVDFEQLTAGEYKRTLTMFGENTDKAREKFQEELEDVHHLFKDFIAQHRPNLDINLVATGEHWYGKQALEMGLIDRIATSDDVITSACKTGEVLAITFEEPRTFSDRLSLLTGKLSDTLFAKIAEKSRKPFI